MNTASKTELPSKYDPSAVEAEASRVWIDEKCFSADPAAPGEPYCIVIPPPNVTGALHLGHAINSTLQDILTRMHRMKGFNTLWVPGIDHAGIATQAVVEKQLKEQENKTRHDVGREGLVERIWKWKEQYGNRILEQLKRIGASCDWDRTRFTLDDMCAKAVRETFFKLFQDGLIYRGKRLVNWDTFLQTSISDDEIYHETVKTFLWHIRYPIEGSPAPSPLYPGESLVGSASRTDSPDSRETVRGADPTSGSAPSSPQAGAKEQAPQRPSYMVVATTRPETMLGDTAVAVHSEDPRWNWAIGKHVRLPLTNRLIPIIADDILVDPKFGTGVVKVTPAHDPNDYAVWQRHKGQADEIDIINMLTPDGKITSDRPEWRKYAGMKRSAARTQVVDDLKAAGLLEKEEPYETQVGHSDRSKTPVEPYLSDQWFVKMAPLAEPALQVVREGKIKFYPERHAQQYLSWLGEKRDWPVSRQLWWGHRIPVWTLRLRDIAEGESAATLVRDEVQRALDAISAKIGDGSAYCANLRPVSIDGSVASVSAARYGLSPVYDSLVVFANTTAASDILDELLHFLMGSVPRALPVRPVHVPQWLPPDAETIFRDRILPSEPDQDPDVLDTWFSSALWPHSTLGWPEQTPELARYYPTNVLLTGRDIITLWVARMVMMGMYNMGGKAPAPSPPYSGERDGVKGEAAGSPGAQEESTAGAASQSAPLSARETKTVSGEAASGSAGQGASPHRPSPGSTALTAGQPSPLGTTRLRSPQAGAREPESAPSSPPVTLSPCHPVTTHTTRRKEAQQLGLPFLDVAINPTILDGKGERMSKSMGNGVDPVDIIDSYGADALRFTLTKMATETQDARMPVKRDAKGKNTSDKFDEGRNFCNKLWNACRFALSNLEAIGTVGHPDECGRGAGSSAQASGSSEYLRTGVGEEHDSTSGAALGAAGTLADRWIVSRFSRAAAECNEALKSYRFDVYAKACYDFFWRDFCDWYVEAIKPAMKDPARAGQTARVLAAVLDGSLRLMHPMIPFITETVWWRLNDVAPDRGLPGRLACPASKRLVLAAWPKAAAPDDAVEAVFEKLQAVIIAIRTIRNEYQVNPKQPVAISIKTSAESAAQIESNRELVELMATCQLKAVRADLPPVADAVSANAAGCDIFAEGLIDANAEKARLTKDIEAKKKSVESLRNRLGNEAYISKAPPHLVKQTKDQLAAAEAEVGKMEEALRKLG